MLQTAYRWYGITLLFVSIICGFIALYYVYQFQSHTNTRFLKLRKPKLIILYCSSSCCVMLLLYPIDLYLSITSRIDDNIFWLWLSTFAHQFIISCMLILITARCWLLYYDHSYGVSLVDKNWKGAITVNQTDFWLTHRKTWGDFGFIICFALIIATAVSITILTISIYALQYDDLLPLHIVSLGVVAVPCCVLMFFIIFSNKLKKVYLYDEFMVVQEMQYLSVSSILMIIVYIIELCQLSSIMELHMFAQTGELLFVFLSTYIQTRWVMNRLQQQSHRHHANKTILKASRNDNTPYLTMRDILKNKDGFTMFMRHCQHELNVEGLLFLVEVAQYKAKLHAIIHTIENTISGKQRVREESETISNDHSLLSLRTISSHYSNTTGDDSSTDSKPLPSLNQVRDVNTTEALQEFEGHILDDDWVPISKQLFKPKHRDRKTSDLVRIANDLQITIFSGDSKDSKEMNDILEMQQQDRKMYEYAQYLFLKYIDVESDYMINLSYSSRKELLLFFSKDLERGFQYILNKNGINQTIVNNRTDQLVHSLLIKHYLYSVFDTTLAEIWKLLSSDTYLRFMHTKQYRYLLKHQKMSHKL